MPFFKLTIRQTIFLVLLEYFLDHVVTNSRFHVFSGFPFRFPFLDIFCPFFNFDEYFRKKRKIIYQTTFLSYFVIYYLIPHDKRDGREVISNIVNIIHIIFICNIYFSPTIFEINNPIAYAINLFQCF